MPHENEIAVFWLRRDLRLEDNTGLYRALQSGLKVLPLFIFDTDILEKLPEKTDARVIFIYQQVKKLKLKLEQYGSSLLVEKGKPADIFRKLVAKYPVKKVFANSDYEPYGIKRDSELTTFFESSGIGFELVKDHVIFEKDEIKKDNGKPYVVYTPYRNKWRSTLIQEHLTEFPSQNLAESFLKTPPFFLPELKFFGFTERNINFPPLRIDRELIKNYEKTRDFPAIRGTTRLGIHLRFGTVSIRKLVKTGLKLSETWLNELIWREFFMMILYHYPEVEKISFKKAYEKLLWRNDEHAFKRWCDGETGFPIVDAGMRELSATGFMHNRVRMIVASFLTKNLLIDWRWGETWFASKLLDYELSSTNGNWQWAAGCGCDAAPYFRVFNPERQAAKYDPGSEYIYHWVPELKKSKNYIPQVVDYQLSRDRYLETVRDTLYKKA